MHLNKTAFGLACGVVWAAVVFFIGLSGAFGLGKTLVNFIGEFYIGFNDTFFGSLAGMVWAFIEGFVAGFILAWVYNSFVKEEEKEDEGQDNFRIQKEK